MDFGGPIMRRRTVPQSQAIVAVAVMVAVYASALMAADREGPAGEVGHDPLGEHIAMMQQMRQDVTPEMVQRMNSEEWHWMHDPARLGELEAHMSRVDRMHDEDSSYR
jgi:hypothetical protein